MEKLILRGVMWGADKIPDSVFESLPGGYYKVKDPKDSHKRHSGDSHRRHRSNSHHRRRHSQDDRRRRRHEDEDAGYRSDGHRDRYNDHRRSRMDDEDDYDPINHRPRRPRSRVMFDDEDEDEYRSNNRRTGRQDSPLMNSRAPYQEPSGMPYRGPVDPPPMYPGVPLAGAGLGAATAAANAHINGSNSPSLSSSQTPPKAATGVYVPYAHIYGQPVRDPPRQPFSTPPVSSNGSVKPNSLNQVSPPVARQAYQQNPLAQEAPMGSQPSYYPDPYHSAHNYNERDFDRYDAYGRTPERYPPTNDEHRRSSSGSCESDDSRERDRRRARSRRRSDNADSRKPLGKGKSGFRGSFDASKHGLGYSAVGALAGGLVGSEVGKGAIPAAVGAAVGAMGANAFGAKERKRHDSRHETWQKDGTYARGEEKRSQREAADLGSREELV